MIHDQAAVILAAISVLLVLGAILLMVALCVSAARADRLLEAWRAERQRATAALDGQRIEPTA